MKPDLNDLVALVGLLLLGAGLWLISPALALIRAVRRGVE